MQRSYITDFAFRTIDFLMDVKYDSNEEFVDLIHSAYEINLDSDFYVLDYSSEKITIAFHRCEPLKPKYKIEKMVFGRSLLEIHDFKDFSCLEENLIPLTYPTSVQTDSTTSNQLPTIENYLEKHATEIKRVYYPGAAIDFSPFQLFGKYIEGVDVYYTDFMSIPVLDNVIKRLETIINSRILTPQDFMQENWEDFWPKYMSWTEMMGRDPREAWGRKFEFHSKELNCTLTYLGTEAVQTAKVLCDNELAPDVLVLQDHGFGGNYASFGGENSFLYQAMQHCLPKYILMNPEDRCTTLWSDYEQVTQAYLPEAFMSLPQNRNSRALFKRK